MDCCCCSSDRDSEAVGAPVQCYRFSSTANNWPLEVNLGWFRFLGLKDLLFWIYFSLLVDCLVKEDVSVDYKLLIGIRYVCMRSYR